MARLVGANRQGALDIGQPGIVPGRQRLLDHGDPQRQQFRGQLSVAVRGPALVGINDDIGRRRPGAYRPDALEIAVTAQLDLQQRTVGVLVRLGPHRLGRIQRQGVGGHHRLRLGQPGQLPDRGAGQLRPQVPKRAIDRVARRTRRHQRIQVGCRRVTAELRGDRLDIGNHALGEFIVARIGPALAAADLAAQPGLGGDHHNLGHRPARDGPGPGGREPFDRGGELDGAHSASTSRPAPCRNGSTQGRPRRFSVVAR